MAYHYAQYLHHVASRGKIVYPMPLYTNIWLDYLDDDDAVSELPLVVGGGYVAGDYPSGGGTSNVLNIWQKFAPSLDFIAPDVYLTDYTLACEHYRHRDQPLSSRSNDETNMVHVAFGLHTEPMLRLALLLSASIH
jgi:hypothetical protein